MPQLQTLAFDADDTLWHTERYFQLTQRRFESLLAPYFQGPHLHEHLIAAERRNINHYGFGVKGFVLSMIETALDVTDNSVPGHVITEILAAGRDMLDHPVEPLRDVTSVLQTLRDHYHLIIVTKGDLLDQQRKIAQSGLQELFDSTHVVSHKTPAEYASIFEQCPGGAEGTMMIGNSMKSDILPPLDIGSRACFIPYELEWDLEHAAAPLGNHRFHEIDGIGKLPALLSHLVQLSPHS